MGFYVNANDIDHLDFGDFIDHLVELGFTKNSIEKRCGFHSGKLTELRKGRQEIKPETTRTIVKVLSQMYEDFAELIEEGTYLIELNAKQYSVYEFTFPDGKKYYGSSINPELRWKGGQGYKTQVVGQAIEKFGWENVEKKIIAENLLKENALAIERALIKATGSDMPGFGYNVY